MSLRAEMIGPAGGLPGFALVLPSGWGSYDPDEGALRERADAALSAVPAPQRAVWNRVLDEALRSTKDWKGGVVVRVFAQTDVAPDSFLPVSIVAARMDAPAGQDIQGVGSRLITTRGAAPLDDGGTILRWERIAPARFADGTASVKTVDYLLPVPGAPTRGLWLQTSILAEAGGTRVDDEGVAFMTALSDAIVASVRWKRHD